MDIKYVNSRNQEVNLNKEPYKMLVSDLLDYEWEEVVYNNKIRGFGYSVSEKELNIDVFRGNGQTARDNMNDLTDIFETDVISGIPGRLYINDQYMNCFIKSSKKTGWETNEIIPCTYGLITDYPFWIKEQKRGFFPQNGVASSGLDYQFDYKHDYTGKQSGSEDWYIDHFAPSKFVMNIYGPCVNPKVDIGDNTVEIFDTVNENEYIQIDSRNHTVVKYMTNGFIKNLYDNRAKDKSIFNPMHYGNAIVSWNGTFGFDVTLFLERSEPKCN